MVSVVSADPALNLLLCCCLSCLRRFHPNFIVFVIPVGFVNATRLKTIGLANHSF